MSFGTLRINSFRGVEQKAISFISRRPALNKVAVGLLPIQTQVRLGITTLMTPKRALAVIRTPLPNIQSIIEARIAAKSPALGLAKAVFYAPLNGLNAILRGLDKVWTSIGADGASFGLALECSGSPLTINESEIPGVLFMSGKEGPDKLAFTGDEDVSEVIGMVSRGNTEMAKLLNIVADLARIEGTVTALEMSGIDLDPLLDEDNKEKFNKAFADFIVRLAETKEGFFRLLASLELPKDPSQAISNLGQDAIRKNEELSNLHLRIRELQEDLTRAQNEAKAYLEKGEALQRDLGAANTRIDKLLQTFDEVKEMEKLKQDLLDATAKIKELDNKLKMSMPLIEEHTDLISDLSIITVGVANQDHEKIELGSLKTVAAKQFVDVLIPVLKEVNALRGISDKLVSDIANHSQAVLEAIRANQLALAARVEGKENLIIIQQQELKTRAEQASKINDELMAYKASYEFYTELTKRIRDLRVFLDRARSGKITRSEIKQKAVGLETLLEKISSGTEAETEPFIPELLDIVVNKLVELMMKEEMFENIGELLRQVTELCRNNNIDTSSVKVGAAGEIAMSLDDALKALDQSGKDVF